jgi:hypothetical protein
MTPAGAHLVANIVGHASIEVIDEVQLRVVAYWTEVDADLGARVAEGLGQDTDTPHTGGHHRRRVEDRASMTPVHSRSVGWVQLNGDSECMSANRP